ncbi:MAG: viroplasmin family protein [Bacteroidales bacterium]
MAKIKFYVVWNGVKPGIYNNWQECQAQIKGFAGAKYKSFSSAEEANRAFDIGYSESMQQVKSGKLGKGKKNINDVPCVLPSISVDAACSGNPGKMEYQGVWTATGERIFYQGPFMPGTNNIGEFLALVHGLALCKQKNLNYPIYSDSRTAISWVKNKNIKTTLPRNAKTQKLFDLVDRAIYWLKNNDYSTQILKWDTENWGEIPADFGRK